MHSNKRASLQYKTVQGILILNTFMVRKTSFTDLYVSQVAE